MSTPLAPKMAAVFILDCSQTMDRLQPFLFSSPTAGGPPPSPREARPIDVMKTFVKAKIAQRIIRELATNPISALTVSVNKTKNRLNAQAKQEDDYSKEDDPYRNMYEAIPWEYALSRATLDTVDGLEAGNGPDSKPDATYSASLNAALLVGLEMILGESKVLKYSAKEIYLLTDGERESDWDDLRDTARRLGENGVQLTVIGFNFDEPESGFVEKNKSTNKRENEARLRELVTRVGGSCRFLTATQAIQSIGEPVVKEVNSVAVPMQLTVGERPDDINDPDYDRKLARSVAMHVIVKKAVTSTQVKTMKKMSLKGFARREARREAHSQSQRVIAAASQDAAARAPPAEAVRLREAEKLELIDRRQLRQLRQDMPDDFEAFAAQVFEEARERLAEAGYDTDALRDYYITSERVKRETGTDLGHLGKSLHALLHEAGLAEGGEEDADPHAVVAEQRFFYKPSSGPKPDADEGAESEEEDDEGSLRPADGSNLTMAYHYGGDIIDVGGMEGGTGLLTGLETGIQLNGFMKKKVFRFDWRYGDVSYVYADPKFHKSGETFSALLNALEESDSLAIVRYVGRSFTRNEQTRFPDPKMCALWPVIGADGLEYAYMCSLPFAEDVRAITFPSLTHLVNRKGNVVTEHPFLPTPAQTSAMDDFVDAMDLVEPASDLDEEPRSFFAVDESYSPAIHNIQNTLLFKMASGEGELPPPAEVLTRFMRPPDKVRDRARGARERLREAMGVKYVPPAPKNIRKQATNFGRENDDEELLKVERLFGTAPDGGSPVQSKPKPTPAPTAPTPDVEMIALDSDEGGEEPNTEPGTDDETGAEAAEDVKDVKPAVATMEVEDDEDDEDEPGPLSLTDPLPDFDDRLAQFGAGQAIRLAFACAEELVAASFSTAKYPLAIGVLQAARAAAVKVLQKKAGKLYDAPVRRLVGTLRADRRKADFVGVMRREGVGLVAAESEEEGEGLWVA